MPERRLTRVLVDASNCKPGQGGVRTYTLGLVRALSGLGGFEVVVATSLPADFAPLGVAITTIPSATRKFGARLIWRERSLPRLLEETGADVLLAPVPELPLRHIEVPAIMVVHDVGPLVERGLYGWPRWLRYRAALPRACRSADAVVCVSRATDQELTRAVPQARGKVRVIGQGPQLFGESAGRNGAAASARPFVLYVGSAYAHKNLSTLVRAFAAPGPALEAELRIVGPENDSGSANIRELCARLGIADRVRLAGYVSSDELAQLYRDALVLALPSLYEGFGLTVLEAMNAGTPVVASELPAVREIAGDAAWYVGAPRDPRAWRSALAGVCSAPALRDALRARALQRATRHTWAAAGAQFGALIREVAAVR
jgi:glycosyltransferase involved in cell wall biosynthesis